MKLLISALTAQSYLTALAAAAGASTFIGSAQPVDPVDTIQTQLAKADGSVFFGNIKYSSSSEPLILSYPGGNGPGGIGGTSFTSFHSAQTGWQNLYIFPDDVKPIGFTQPHSGSVPAGAVVTDFTVNATDKFFRYKTFDRWYACKTETTPANSYQVFYVGEGLAVPEGCIRIDIATYGYGNCPW